MCRKQLELPLLPVDASSEPPSEGGYFQLKLNRPANAVEAAEHALAWHRDVVRVYLTAGETELRNADITVDQGADGMSMLLLHVAAGRQALGEHDMALRVLDHLIQQHGRERRITLRRCVAQAKLRRARVLIALERREEALETLSDLGYRLEGDQDPELMEVRTDARIARVELLRGLGRLETCLTLCGRLEAEFLTDVGVSATARWMKVRTVRLEVLYESQQTEAFFELLEEGLRLMRARRDPVGRLALGQLLDIKTQILRLSRRDRELFATNLEILEVFADGQLEIERRFYERAASEQRRLMRSLGMDN